MGGNRQPLYWEKGWGACNLITDDIVIRKGIFGIADGKGGYGGRGCFPSSMRAAYREKEIKRVYLAGGFGNYMDQRSAMEIGLLGPAASGKSLA